jgi:hypothetical protein
MFNHSVMNYYTATFVLKEAKLKTGTDPVSESQLRSV